MNKNFLKYFCAFLFCFLATTSQAQDTEWKEAKTNGSLSYSYRIANATGHDMLVIKVENKTENTVTTSFTIIVSDRSSSTPLYKYENIEVSVDPGESLTGDPVEGYNPQLIFWDPIDGKTINVKIIEKP